MVCSVNNISEVDIMLLKLDILLEEVKKRKEFEKTMEELDNNIDILRELFENEPEQIFIIFQELLGSII
jgi:hypothetical protein